MLLFVAQCQDRNLRTWGSKKQSPCPWIWSESAPSVLWTPCAAGRFQRRCRGRWKRRTHNHAGGWEVGRGSPLDPTPGVLSLLDPPLVFTVDSHPLQGAVLLQPAAAAAAAVAALEMISMIRPNHRPSHTGCVVSCVPADATVVANNGTRHAGMQPLLFVWCENPVIVHAQPK